MYPDIHRLPSDPSQPAQTEVVVVGGGIIGVSAALCLAEKGVPVVLCEKGEIAGEQSSRNWGWVRKMGRQVRDFPLAVASERLWEGMSARVGRDVGYRQSGIAYLCETEDMVAQQAAWLESVREFQPDSRIERGRALEEILPGSARTWAGALVTASDGRAEPHKAAFAMAEGARRAGATILTGCAVRGVEWQAGHVSGVVTERGRVRCRSVIVAGGAWSRLFLGNLGIDFPQLRLLGSVMRTARLPGGPEIAAGASNFAFRKRLDGGYTIANRHANIVDIVPDSFRLFFDFLPAYKRQRNDIRLRLGRPFVEEWRQRRRWSLDEKTPFEAIRVLDPRPSELILAEGKANITAAFPFFANMQVMQSWGGMIDATPDALPIISAVPARPGLVLASGFSGHGFGTGPAAGRLAVDLVTGDSPIIDPTPYRFERFRPTPGSA